MKKILSMLAVVAMVSVGLVAGAFSASAHTQRVAADCSGWSVNLTKYAPIVAGHSEVSHTEYLFEHAPHGKYKTRWESDKNWNAQGNPHSTGWRLVTPLTTRTVIDKKAEPREVNTVTISIDGAVVSGPTEFGETFNSNGTWSKTADHTVSVTVTSSDGIGAGTFTASSTACESLDVEVTPTAPKWVDECGPGNGHWTFTDTAEYVYTTKTNKNGSITVTVAPKAGFVFPAGTKVQWTKADSNVTCPVVVVPPVTTPPVTETVTPTPTETVIPPVTETTTAPVVTTTASPTVTTPAKQLAYTGFNAWIYAGIGFALILAGGVLLAGRKYTLDRKH